MLGCGLSLPVQNSVYSAFPNLSDGKILIKEAKGYNMNTMLLERELEVLVTKKVFASRERVYFLTLIHQEWLKGFDLN